MDRPRSSIFLCCFVAIFWFCALEGQAKIPYHAWQFHTLDIPYVSAAMKKAGQYDINTVVFSHEMISKTSQLSDGTDRGGQLRALADEAHGLDLRVWIWVHELDSVPEDFLRSRIVQLDRPGFWRWLEDRYDEVFKRYPEFDGLMLTFHETQYPLFRDDKVQSKLSKPQRFARLISTIHKVCVKHHKELIVRTFLYEPIELQWVKEGLLLCDSDVIVQSKCVPHDWDPYYPPNPLIGAFPKNRQIIEFDCSSEFTGKNRIPYTAPEYFEYHWRRALQYPGVVGYNARVDHGGYDAISTPNEINLYALCRLTADPLVTATEIWQEWSEKHYGEAAAPLVKEALSPSFAIVNKTLFPLGFWTTDKSILPGFKYANGHISERSIAKWLPDQPSFKAFEQRLNHPDPELLEEILAERDSTIAMACQSLLSLEAARPLLTTGQYEELYWRMELLRHTTLVWKAHLEAFFGYKVLLEGHQVPGLRQRIQRSIDALFCLADVSEKNPRIGGKPPASAREIRAAASELQSLLDAQKSAK
jgi:hypothetical protein